MKRLNVELRDAVHRELKLVAMHQGTTISALVNQLVVSYLKSQNDQNGRPRRRKSDWHSHLELIDQREPAGRDRAAYSRRAEVLERVEQLV